MDKTYDGFTWLEDEEGKRIKFSFFLQDYKIRLVCCDDGGRYQFHMFEPLHIEMLSGELLDGYLIFFPDIILHPHAFGRAFHGGVASFILGKNNVNPYREFSNFEAITFYGDVVDKFYNPIRKFDYKHSDLENDTGEALFRLKSYADTTVTHSVDFKGQTMRVELSVTKPGGPTSSHFELGKLKSIIRLSAEKPWALEDIHDIYWLVIHFFMFINFRKDIRFDSIILSNRDAAGLYSPKAYFHANVSHECNNRAIWKTIQYEDLDDRFPNLFTLIDSKQQHYEFIPDSDKDARYIKHHNYMLTSSAFEYIYRNYYPSEMESDAAWQELRQGILSKIDEAIANTPEPYLQDAKKLRLAAEREDGRTLRVCFKSAVQNRQSILAEVFGEFKFGSDKINNISYDFKSKRDMLAHGDLENFNNIDVQPYQLAQCLIYYMLLEQAGVAESSIRKILTRVFPW